MEIRKQMEKQTIKIKLSGQDGNALSILARCLKAMQKAGCTGSEIEEFKKEATAGDYDHLLRTVTEWFDVE